MIATRAMAIAQYGRNLHTNTITHPRKNATANSINQSALCIVSPSSIVCKVFALTT